MAEWSVIPALSISPDKVFCIAARVRKSDPVRAEIASLIRDLNEDERIDLVALAWLGRGDGGIENWNDLRAEASRAHNRRAATHLSAMPLLADHLEDGLSEFGHFAEEFEQRL